MRSNYFMGSVAIFGLAIAVAAGAQTSGAGAGSGAGAAGGAGTGATANAPTQSPGNPSSLSPAAGQATSPGNPSPGNPLTAPSGQPPGGTAAQRGVQPGQTGTAESMQQQRTPTSSQLNTNPSGNLQQQTDQQRLLNESRPNSFGTLNGNGSDAARSTNLRGDGGAAPRAERLAEQAQLRGSLQRMGINVANSDDWRFVDHRGRWWFYTPDRSWMYYSSGNWIPFEPRSSVNRLNASLAPRQNVAFPNAYPAESWRLVSYNGAWWYWTPDNSWLVLGNGNEGWIPFRDRRGIARNMERERQSVGYRGQARSETSPPRGDGQAVEPVPQTEAPAGQLDHEVLPTDRANMPALQPGGVTTQPQNQPESIR